MSSDFDPYHKWLGISPKDQPPDHYRLLAVDRFESDQDVIYSAADQRMAHVHSFQTGKHADLSQRILNEIAAARVCLLDPEKKREYDRQLRQKMEPAAVPRPLPMARPLPTVVPIPVAAPSAAHPPLTPEPQPKLRLVRPHGQFRHHSRSWQIPAAIGAVAVVFALVITFIVVSGNLPETEETAHRSSEIDAPAIPSPGAETPATDSQQVITNSIGIKLKLIPAGEFVMGSPEGEANRGDDEYQHRVRITKPFYLGVYEVTQGEYERVMGTNPSEFKSVSGEDTSRFPVEQVSWEEAADFCGKLSALSAERTAGRSYSLPTEAEWEYACRSGTTTPFRFGTSLNGGEANCDGNYPYGIVTKGTYLARTTPVGSYEVNAFGLCDLHGNVWEWCQDWYEWGYYRGSPVDDPQGPTAASYRVIRGGSWFYYARDCRSAERRGISPSSRNSALGFRVALVPSGR